MLVHNPRPSPSHRLWQKSGPHPRRKVFREVNADVTRPAHVARAALVVVLPICRTLEQGRIGIAAHSREGQPLGTGSVGTAPHGIGDADEEIGREGALLEELRDELSLLSEQRMPDRGRAQRDLVDVAKVLDGLDVTAIMPAEPILRPVTTATPKLVVQHDNERVHPLRIADRLKAAGRSALDVIHPKQATARIANGAYRPAHVLKTRAELAG